MMICYAHLHGGAIDEAQRHADELASIGRRRNDEEAMAYALAVGARVKLMRGDLAGARSLFADAAALARARSAAWPRSIALCGLASVTLAAGDEVGARAILEEALLFCGGVGYVGIDSLCGALALLLVKTGERDRARLASSTPWRRGRRTKPASRATSTDPSGALRAATREARALLGDPPGRDPAVRGPRRGARGCPGRPPSARVVVTNAAGQRSRMNGVDPALVDQLEAEAAQVPGVAGVHAVQVRWEGHRLFADLAIGVSPHLRITEAHTLAHTVEHDLLDHLAHLENITVHVEPDALLRADEGDAAAKEPARYTSGGSTRRRCAHE